jgi:hypothetical protein
MLDTIFGLNLLRLKKEPVTCSVQIASGVLRITVGPLSTERRIMLGECDVFNTD